MTARFECELTCDHDPGFPFACATPVVFGTTAKEAREAAAAAGWITTHREGKVLDLCPDHWQASDLPKRPRGLCSVCGQDRALNSSGTVVTHNEIRLKGNMRRWLDRCAGSHKPPVGAVSGSGEPTKAGEQP